MKRTSHLLLLLTLLCAALAAQPAQARKRPSARPFVLVIDAGHGGRDLGASGRRTHEKDLTLKIAKQVSKRVKRDCKNVEVILTRTEDEYVSLEDRAGMANFFNADLFLSIHVNSAPTLAQGTETFVHRRAADGRSEHFARLIQREYREQGERVDRGVKRANFVVLRETRMPSVLTEVGFISHKKEEKFMKSRRGRKRLSRCLADAFRAYHATFAPSH